MSADYILTAGRRRRELKDYSAEEYEWVLNAVNAYWVALTDHSAEEHEWVLNAVNAYWVAQP